MYQNACTRMATGMEPDTEQARAKTGALIPQEPATAPETDYSGFDIVKATQYGSLTRVKELVEGKRCIVDSKHSYTITSNFFNKKTLLIS